MWHDDAVGDLVHQRRFERRVLDFLADVGRELSQMTVGVIGYGHIGTKVVRLLKAFGGRILVADPYVELKPEDARDGVARTMIGVRNDC